MLGRARSLIYLEDQYLWSPQVATPLAEALTANPGLHLIAVIPRYPDQDGRLSLPPNILGHNLALEILHRSGGDRVAVYGIENHDGTPVYVHAKACVIDDAWASVGSGNLNRRSWTHDSELSCAVLDAWHAEGRPVQRPPGRLRTYQAPSLSWWTRTWATPLYRCLYDPDGRPPALRRASAF